MKDFKKIITTKIREYLNEQENLISNVELNDNFWKWFNNSKVIDDKGNPLIVHHGSRIANLKDKDFKFDKEKLGAYTKSPSAKQGFFFAKDELTSGIYSGDYRYVSVNGGEPQIVKSRNKIENVNDFFNSLKEKLKNMGLNSKGINIPYYGSYSYFGGHGDLNDDVSKTEIKNELIKYYKERFDEIKEKGLKCLNDFENGHLNNIIKIDNRNRKSWLLQINKLKEDLSEIDTIFNIFKKEISKSKVEFKLEDKNALIGKFFLKIENPLIVDQGGSRHRIFNFNKLLIKAKKEGNDGVIIKNTFDPTPTDVYVVFNEFQIKSVNNKGNWDIDDDRVYY